MNLILFACVAMRLGNWEINKIIIMMSKNRKKKLIEIFNPIMIKNISNCQLKIIETIISKLMKIIIN